MKKIQLFFTAVVMMALVLSCTKESIYMDTPPTPTSCQLSGWKDVGAYRIEAPNVGIDTVSPALSPGDLFMKWDGTWFQIEKDSFWMRNLITEQIDTCICYQRRMVHPLLGNRIAYRLPGACELKAVTSLQDLSRAELLKVEIFNNNGTLQPISWVTQKISVQDASHVAVGGLMYTLQGDTLSNITPAVNSDYPQGWQFSKYILSHGGGNFQIGGATEVFGIRWFVPK